MAGFKKKQRWFLCRYGCDKKYKSTSGRAQHEKTKHGMLYGEMMRVNDMASEEELNNEEEVEETEEQITKNKPVSKKKDKKEKKPDKTEKKKSKGSSFFDIGNYLDEDEF